MLLKLFPLSHSCKVDLDQLEVQRGHDLLLPLVGGAGSIRLILVISGIPAEEGEESNVAMETAWSQYVSYNNACNYCIENVFYHNYFSLLRRAFVCLKWMMWVCWKSQVWSVLLLYRYRWIHTVHSCIATCLQWICMNKVLFLWNDIIIIFDEINADKINFIIIIIDVV